MVFRHLPITAAIDEPLSQPFPPLPRPGANQAPLHSPEAVAEGDLVAALEMNGKVLGYPNSGYPNVGYPNLSSL